MSKKLDKKISLMEAGKQELWKLRHTSEHVLTQAMESLFGDKIIKAMGPATDSGFYFDFETVGGLKVTESDFPKIEKEMGKIIRRNLPLIKKMISADESKEMFKGNSYKEEWIALAKERGEEISIFWTGDPKEDGSFVDLCSGPHVESTGKISAFKLLSVAGAYWHGDEKNKMLTRIYGTAFYNKADLDLFLFQIEEAKRRDHRKLGKELGLFVISQDVGSGFPLFTPRGTIVRQELERWIMEEKKKRDFKFVWTPHVARSSLYQKSGHWQKYDAMFNPMKLDGEDYVLKPMNCPHHFQLYLERPRSYRELPLRLAENATVYRFEKAGELNGLLRVRALTQDDTHIFLRNDQIGDEIDSLIELAMDIFKTFGFKDFRASLSVRDKSMPEKYLGDPKVWDKAEKELEKALKKHKFEYFVGEGEAAFYGPKIDIVVKDGLGREWQLTTIQLDFNQPNNFDMNYINETGESVRAAVIHVAILGSVERFLGILIEHFAGALPLWLAPVQVMVIPISEKVMKYAEEVRDSLSVGGVRAEIDLNADSLGKKIRNAETAKLPYMVVVGEKESESGEVSIRRRGEAKQYNQKLGLFVEEISEKVKSRTLL